MQNISTGHKDTGMPWHISGTTFKESPPGPLLLTLPGPHGETIFSKLPWNSFGRAVIFLDSDRRRLKGAQGPLPLQARAVRMPIQSQTFGCVCSFEALFAIRPPWTVLAEYHRILKPDGMLFLFEPASHGLFSSMRDKLVGPGKRIYPLDEVRDRLCRAGYQVVSAEPKARSKDYPHPAYLLTATKIDFPAEPPPEIITTKDLRARQRRK